MLENGAFSLIEDTFYPYMHIVYPDLLPDAIYAVDEPTNV